MGEEGIIPTASCRNIGVVFDGTLTFETPNSVCKTSFWHLRNIWRIRAYLDKSSLIHALITNKLDYCNSLFTGLPKFLIKRLQSVQNAAAGLFIGSNKQLSYHANSAWAPLAPYWEAYDLQNFSNYFQLLKQSGIILSIWPHHSSFSRSLHYKFIMLKSSVRTSFRLGLYLTFLFYWEELERRFMTFYCRYFSLQRWMRGTCAGKKSLFDSNGRDIRQISDRWAGWK